MADERRSVEVVVDVAATPDEVWKALTDADEMVRWFPLQAAVRPEVGGQITWQWDGQFTWVSEIERWDPGVALTLVNRDQRPYDVEGRELPAGQASSATLVMEFTLESVEGKTRLRLVHSGFGRGASWDDEFEGVSVGWRYELRSLKFYLERHAGRPRRAGLASFSCDLSHSEAWRRLVGSAGFPFDRWPLVEGDSYRVRSAAGDRFTGTVLLHIPERDLCCRVAELGDGLLRLATHGAGGRTGVTVWIASYAADPGHVEELRSRAQGMLEAAYSR
jgi:uncharacterized protein YndB with AHSA1/START domain